MRSNSYIIMEHNKVQCELSYLKTDDQFVFVQYCDVLGDEHVPMDSVKDRLYDKLNCIRLNWERYGHHEKAREYGKVFVPCPWDSVRGRVHIVRPDVLVEVLHDTVPYK